MNIPGSNNGVWGVGQYGALYPSDMGGPSGYRGYPLPNQFQHATGVNSFGQNVYSLTPGGITSSPSWGYGRKSRKSKSRKSKSRKSKSKKF